MKTQSNKKKITFLTIFSIALALILTTIIELSTKKRYSSEIKISTIFNNDSIALEAIRIYLGYDPSSNFVNDYMSKMNLKMYNSKNSCSEIEKNNRIMPLLITKISHGFRIEISSNDKKKIIECQQFISEEIKQENLRINSYLISLLKIKRKQNREKGSIDMETMIYYLNLAKQKFQTETNLNEDTITDVLSNYILDIIPEDEFNKNVNIGNELALTLESVKEIRYFQIISDEITSEEGTTQIFLFSGLFLIIIIIVVALNKISQRKKKIISKLNNLLG